MAGELMDKNVEVVEEIDVIDRISKIIHEAWMEWTKSISDIEYFDQLILKVDRWEELWVPYEQLSDAMKEKDREWARKIIIALGHGGGETSEDADGLLCEKFAQYFKKLREEYGGGPDSDEKLANQRSHGFAKIIDEAKMMGWSEK